MHNKFKNHQNGASERSGLKMKREIEDDDENAGKEQVCNVEQTKVCGDETCYVPMYQCIA